MKQGHERVTGPTVIENKQDDSVVPLVEVLESENRVTTRGRHVTLPQRFRK